MTTIQTPDTTTPGIYDFDLDELQWAATFVSRQGERAPELGVDPDADHYYPRLTGMATCNTRSLLNIINRLAERVREQDHQLAIVRDAVNHHRCRTLRPSLASLPRPDGGLIGRQVSRTDDDSSCPKVGTIVDGTDSPEFVMVAWLPADAALPGVIIREALDELTGARE